MSKVNYYLKNQPNSNYLEKLKKAKDKEYYVQLTQKRPIIMSVAHKGIRILITTGKFTSLKEWDTKAKRIKIITESSEESFKNREWLDTKKSQVERYLENHLGQINKSIIEEVLFGGGITYLKEIKSWTEAFDFFLKHHKNKDGSSLKTNSRKKYRSLSNHIENYQNSILFTPNLYTSEWIVGLKDHLAINADLNDNTISKYIKGLKTFIRFYIKKGVNIKIDIDEIKVPENEQLVIALNDKELYQIENLELESQYHQQIRDFFLFQCYTGSRYSDAASIKHEDLDIQSKTATWSYMSIKLDTEVSAPLIGRAIKILNKYSNNDKPIPKYSNQAINREIKKIAKLAQLDRIIKQVYFKDGLRSEKYYHLFDKISTHYARKTFITLSLRKGIQERKVRAITGHKDERSFRRYVDYSVIKFDDVKEAWD